MNKTTNTVRPGGRLLGNFNRILAVVGLGWLASTAIVRYVIKPWRVNNRMKENEELMNFLYDEQQKAIKEQDKFEI